MVDLPNFAFIGKAGSGKDTAAEVLIETLGYRRLAFADKLKDVAETLWGPDARTDRDKLQPLGTLIRDIEPDTWVDLALAKLTDGKLAEWDGRSVKAVDSMPVADRTLHPVAVTDCRFHNEAWALKGEGFTIVRIVADRNERINRLRTNGKLGTGEWETHISETDLDTWPEDYKIANLGTKAELLDELARVIALETGTTGP